jgi:putative nucleotidyltransferase with HDIG domain
MKLAAKAYLGAVCISGAAICVYAVLHGATTDPLRFGCYFALAMLAAGLKVRLPGITGTMSVIFLFLLLGVIELSFIETLMIGYCGTLIQCLWKPKVWPRPIQVAFSVAAMSNSVAAAYLSYSYAAQIFQHSVPLQLAVSASAFFAANTVQVTAVVSLTEGKPFRKLWLDSYFWSYPYFLAGAAIAGMLAGLNRWTGWQTTLLVLPVVYWIYRSYDLYLGKMADEKRYVEEMASLHLRTIEALALAIDAKDHTTHEHLRRVRVYAVEVGKQLGMAAKELDAVRAAALLHDIGKLAVPEHIISKPGKLTPEEFEKVKIHPIVGAEILQRVQFPYEVVPIVRHHHEKWNGSGYPDGIRGEDIPLGARIIAAVDCLDALASDRQYRRAMPLGEAMGVVASEAGQSFDPRVVKVLQEHFVEFERMAQQEPLPEAYLSTDVKVERGDAPAAGFEKGGGAEAVTSAAGESADVLQAIATARSEAQLLQEFSLGAGKTVSLAERLAMLAVRVKRLVPHDAMAVYLKRNGELIPEYVGGEDGRFFSALRIPVGQGVSGWVAENRKAILNASPSVESAHAKGAAKHSTLQSALAIPLEGLSEVTGVLTIYRTERDAFTKDDLRVLQAMAAKTALWIEKAVKFREGENSAISDGLTGLPNARALYAHLNQELARAERSNTGFTYLVCDVEGFEAVVEQHGQRAGDEWMKRFAGIREKCEKFRSLAESAAQAACGSAMASLSIGYAVYPEHGTESEALLEHAERMLHAAKRQKSVKTATTENGGASPSEDLQLEGAPRK